MTATRTTVAEEEYFRRQEANRRRDEAWDNLQKTSRANQPGQARLKAGQLRLCPECKTALQKRTLRGVELDQCGSCHGCWIEAGEFGRKKRGSFLAKLFSTGRGGVDK